MIVSQLGARSESARGMLIATEGVDGIGKTTVAHCLQLALNKDCNSGVCNLF